MLNATREYKGLGIRRIRNPLPISPPMRIVPVTQADGTVKVELHLIIPKVKQQKVYPQGKY